MCCRPSAGNVLFCASEKGGRKRNSLLRRKHVRDAVLDGVIYLTLRASDSAFENLFVVLLRDRELQRMRFADRAREDVHQFPLHGKTGHAIAWPGNKPFTILQNNYYD